MKLIQNILLGTLLVFIFCRGYYSSVRNRKDLCPKIYPWVFIGYRPFGKYYFKLFYLVNNKHQVPTNVLGKEVAGRYDKIPNVTFNECIVKCCESDGCNVVFMHKNDCYTVWYFVYFNIVHRSNSNMLGKLLFYYSVLSKQEYLANLLIFKFYFHFSISLGN